MGYLRGRIPKQQGLKLFSTALHTGNSRASRAHSKTTRIETFFNYAYSFSSILFEGAFQNNKD